MSAPLLLCVVVVAQNGEDHSLQCAFTKTGQQPGFPVRMSYDGPADAEWVRTVAERWVEDLQRLNK